MLNRMVGYRYRLGIVGLVVLCGMVWTGYSRRALREAWVQIQGTVYTPDRQPIPHLTIRLYRVETANGDRTQQLLQVAQTDGNGRYLFTALKPGEYVLQIPVDHTPGYEVRLALQRRTTHRVDFYIHLGGTRSIPGKRE